MSLPDLATATDIARWLHIQPRLASRLLRLKEPAARSSSAHLLYRKSDVIAWANAHRIRA